MTLREIVERVDEVRPNAYTEEDKLWWLNELEFSLQTNVFDQTEDFAAHETLEEETLLPAAWSKVYTSYLEARIAGANGEWNEYANLIEVYNGFVGEYQRWYARHYVDTD